MFHMQRSEEMRDVSKQTLRGYGRGTPAKRARRREGRPEQKHREKPAHEVKRNVCDAA